MSTKTNATIPIYEIRCKLSTDLALKKITKEEKEKIEKYLGLDRKEKEYEEESEKNFIKDLYELFSKWNILLYAEGLSVQGRIELLNERLKKSFWWGKGLNHIEQKEILLLPKISKRRELFDNIKFNKNVKIEDVRPILKEITNVDKTSLFYKTDKEFKEMIEALKEKYNLY